MNIIFRRPATCLTISISWRVIGLHALQCQGPTDWSSCMDLHCEGTHSLQHVQISCLSWRLMSTHGQDAGLASTLADASERAMVFAPTDDAFSNLLDAIGLTAQQLLADPSTLGEVSKS